MFCQCDSTTRRYGHTSRAALTVLAFVVVPLVASAAEPKQAEQPPEPKVLVVDPAPEPIPALKYHLLVPGESKVPGNAAPIYERIVHERNDAWKSKLRNEPSRFLDMASDEWRREEARQVP